MSQSSLAPPKNASLEQAAFARSTTVAIAIRVTGLGLSYLVQVSLARWLGKTEFGIYEYVVSWALLLQVPAEVTFSPVNPVGSNGGFKKAIATAAPTTFARRAER